MLITKRKPVSAGEMLIEEFMQPLGLTQSGSRVPRRRAEVAVLEILTVAVVGAAAVNETLLGTEQLPPVNEDGATQLLRKTVLANPFTGVRVSVEVPMVPVMPFAIVTVVAVTVKSGGG